MSSSEDEFHYTNAAKTFAKLNECYSDDSIQLLEDDTGCDSSAFDIVDILCDKPKTKPKLSKQKQTGNKNTVRGESPIKTSLCGNSNNQLDQKITRNCRTRQQIKSAYADYAISVSNTETPVVVSTGNGPRGRKRGKGGSTRGRGRPPTRKSGTSTDPELSNEYCTILSDTEEIIPKRRKGRPRKSQPKRGEIITELIVLSDTEDTVSKKETFPNTAAIVADVNFEIPVKVWWQFRQVDKFTIRRYQSLQVIFDFYSKREGLPESRLLFMLNDAIIKSTDTPDALNLGVGTIIEGGFLSEERNPIVDTKITSSINNDELIPVKLQMRDQKKPVVIHIKKTEPFSVLMAKSSEQLNMNVKLMDFYFDGELINPNDTPEILDFVGDECVDVHCSI